MRFHTNILQSHRHMAPECMLSGKRCLPFPRPPHPARSPGINFFVKIGHIIRVRAHLVDLPLTP